MSSFCSGFDRWRVRIYASWRDWSPTIKTKHFKWSSLSDCSWKFSLLRLTKPAKITLLSASDLVNSYHERWTEKTVLRIFPSASLLSVLSLNPWFVLERKNIVKHWCSTVLIFLWSRRIFYALSLQANSLRKAPPPRLYHTSNAWSELGS